MWKRLEDEEPEEGRAKWLGREADPPLYLDEYLSVHPWMRERYTHWQYADIPEPPCEPQDPLAVDACLSFAFLWDSINGKKHPWADNDWVWVYEFRRSDE